MKFNGLRPSAHSFGSTAASTRVDVAPPSAADIESPHYARGRQERLAERLRNAGDRAAVCWNHLITIVISSSDEGDIAALPRTLGSLLAQRYRNFEVLVVGKPGVRPSDSGHFTSCRGLFTEPDLDALDILCDPATDALWRGSHLILAQAGTEFDPDAVELLNVALDNLSDAPALVHCADYQRSDDPDDVSPADFPDRHADVVGSLDNAETAFMVSRTLLRRARWPQQRPISLQDWLRGISAMTPVPHIVHIAEELIHAPPEVRWSSRSAPADAP